MKHSAKALNRMRAHWHKLAGRPMIGHYRFTMRPWKPTDPSMMDILHDCRLTPPRLNIRIVG